MKPSCGCFGWSAFEFFAHFYFGILYKLHGVGGNNSQLGLIIFEYTELHGDAQMIKAKLEGDKLPIPKTILQKAGLSDGDEVEVMDVGIKGLLYKGCVMGSIHYMNFSEAEARGWHFKGEPTTDTKAEECIAYLEKVGIITNGKIVK